MAFSKEATLLFLSVFYFVIATNTQTGWLFVLSAFLLGLLTFSWFLSRRSLEGLSLQQQWLDDPQKNHPFRWTVTLTNASSRSAQEIRVEWPQPEWAEPCQKFGWTVPTLEPGGRAITELRMTPQKRGLHKLPPLTLVGGAPFGLFQVRQTLQVEDTFLVFPDIERLPSPHSRNSLATALGEITTPRGLGETRSVRAIREYRPGDDLRNVHWKASAKRGAFSALLVREHHAHAPEYLTLLLDTSTASFTEDDTLFERAVTLTASLLWSAYREGTKAQLLCLNPRAEWESHRNWPSQYRALAEVCRHGNIDFAHWTQSSELAVGQYLHRETRSKKLKLIRAHDHPIQQWPTWLDSAFLVLDPQRSPRDWPSGPRVHAFDGTSDSFREAPIHV